MIRTYLSKLLLEAIADLELKGPELAAPEHDRVVALWRRPRLVHQGHVSINIKAFICSDNLDTACAQIAAAMLAFDRRDHGALLEAIEAGEGGYLSCRVSPLLAARALCASFSQGGLAESTVAPDLLALPASYDRCRAYLRHAKSGVVDILSARTQPALLGADDWIMLQERWRADASVFVPLFACTDTAAASLELILHIGDVSDPDYGSFRGWSRARIKRYVEKNEILLERFFAACAADKGFFGCDLSVSKARLGLIFAVMHVSLLGLGIMHLSTAE